MPDDEKKQRNGLERWRGRMTADQETINAKLDDVLAKQDATLKECSKRHVCIEHRLTSVEQGEKTLFYRMGVVTKVLIGAVAIIVGTAVAVALFVK